MKQLIFFIGMVLLAAACSVPGEAVKIKGQGEPENIEPDSLTYELETFDSKFDTWYSMHNKPSQYRSQSYYESWNQRYVASWNNNAANPSKSWFFEPIVGYYPNVDYGFELNHELFYYFQYVEKVLKIQIMSGGPQAPVL